MSIQAPFSLPIGERLTDDLVWIYRQEDPSLPAHQGGVEEDGGGRQGEEEWSEKGQLQGLSTTRY